MNTTKQTTKRQVAKGASLLSGGFIPEAPSPLASGSFYPPTVLADVPESANIAQEEIFGPIMCIFKVIFAGRVV
jgi:acyl-CoA reductase-like NAD-dependent aldehyde dehydrogenase